MLGLRRLAIAESHRFPQPAAAFAQGGYQRSVDALESVFSQAGIAADASQRAASVFIQLMVIVPADRAMFGAHLSAEERELHISNAVETFLAAFSH